MRFIQHYQKILIDIVKYIWFCNTFFVFGQWIRISTLQIFDIKIGGLKMNFWTKHLLLQFHLHKKFKNHCNFVYHMLIHSKTLQQLKLTTVSSLKYHISIAYKHTPLFIAVCCCLEFYHCFDIDESYAPY